MNYPSFLSKSSALKCVYLCSTLRSLCPVIVATSITFNPFSKNLLVASCLRSLVGLLGELVFDGLVSLCALKRQDYSSSGVVIPKHQITVKLNGLVLFIFVRGLIHYGRFIRKNLKR